MNIFYKINNLSFKAQKYVFFLFIIVFSIGIVEALVLSPADYKQSDSVRIMYVHVPSAWTSVGIFSVIAILSLGNLIFKNKYFTVNHVFENDIADAHHTSAKYPKEVSEFDVTKLEPEFLDGFEAPFVKSSKVKFACKYLNEYDIKENNTVLVVAAIQTLYVDEKSIHEDGWIQLDKAGTVTINGLDGYAKTSLLNRFEYARPKK